MANCLEHAVKYDLDGTFNCAADGVLVLSEVVDLLGKTMVPVLPPWGTALAAQGLRRAGVPIQSEMLPSLRFGRALDNRRYKATGFVYQHTTRETVLRLREQQRLEPILRGAVGTQLPLRVGGRGVPALQPERAPVQRAAVAAGARQLGAARAPASRSSSRPRRRRRRRRAPPTAPCPRARSSRSCPR